MGKVFPTSNRSGLLLAIKDDFRRDMNETDPEKVIEMLQHALQGHRQMSQYYNQNTSSGSCDIEINLEQTPFIKPADGVQIPKKKGIIFPLCQYIVRFFY